jgi:hypothetical protein
MEEEHETAQAIWGTLKSPNEWDSNYEPANVVDGLYFIGRAVHALANAVKGLDVSVAMVASAIDRTMEKDDDS